MKKVLAWLLLLTMLISAVGGTAENEERGDMEQLNVGNPTPLNGCFLPRLWGGTTSDLDVQSLLHAYSPVIWDNELVRYRYDHSVVQNALAFDDEKGNRTYVLVFYDDLQFSDGTKITAFDYAFSILLAMDKAVTECGGQTEDFSWLVGSDEYLSGEAKVLSGVRVVTEQMLQIQVKAEALPYFYELSRMILYPYPIEEIAPGIIVMDDGKGVYLTEPLTAEMLKKTVLDPKEGYLSHPKTVSGPYTLASFNGKVATFRKNTKYKGNEEGWKPQINSIRYTLANNADMIEQMDRGNFGLLNKVTMAETIRNGLNLQKEKDGFAMANYARTGLTLIRFMENSLKAQDTAVRKAVALCFDRDGFTREYAGPFGIRMDAFCGIGQWMYRLASGHMEVPEKLEEAKTTLDGVTKYECDTEKANALLNQAGWTLDENGGAYVDGVRYKEINGEMVGLTLTMGIPESEELTKALETYLLPNLMKAGIQLALRPIDMDLVEKYYQEEDSIFDLLYLGENFSILFDPLLLAPTKGETEGESLTEARRELQALAQEMVRTEPTDVAAFMAKWVKLQERISETLPVLPVYSNAYFDFYSRKLHQYNITDTVTWGEAIVKSYLSDAEEQEEEIQQEKQNELNELEKQYGE